MKTQVKANFEAFLLNWRLFSSMKAFLQNCGTDFIRKYMHSKNILVIEITLLT
jgi:hypothetical protein